MRSAIRTKVDSMQLVRMFEQALTVTDQLSAEQRRALIARLDRTRGVVI